MNNYSESECNHPDPEESFDAMFGGSQPAFRQPEQPLDEPYIEDEPMPEEEKEEAAFIAIIDKDSPHREAYGNVAHDDGEAILSKLVELCDNSSNKDAGIYAKAICRVLLSTVKEGIE